MINRSLASIRKLILVPIAVSAMFGLASAGPGVPVVQAAQNHTVTLVNQSGRTIWVGASVNADGSANLSGLPRLENGQSATVTIPENAGPGWWRGKFFARTGCTGSSGSDFRCEVGDCGNVEDRCVTGEQPSSLAEFNFDTHDAPAPWYNVSYVNAFSLPVTIDANDAVPPPGSNSCESVGCSGNLLPNCPASYLEYDRTGAPDNCVNPNRDARTDYVDSLSPHCPKAYFWSKQDTEPGNQTVRQCAQCSGFTVTF